MENTTWKYLREIYAHSLEDVRNRLGTKGAGAILFLKILLAIIAIMSLISLGLLESDQPGYAIAFTIFASDIIGLVLLWVASPFIAIWNMPKVAADKNKVQIERLDEVDPDLEKIILEGYNDFIHRTLGIDIKNTTSYDFNGVIEIINLEPFLFDEHCNEHDMGNLYDISNCHFELPLIKGNDHRTVSIAKLQDDKIIFLTEKTIPMLIEMMFMAPEPIPEPDHIKMHFYLDFEIRGTIGDKSYNRRHGCLIDLYARIDSKTNDSGLLGSRVFTSNIEISEITRDYGVVSTIKQAY